MKTQRLVLDSFEDDNYELIAIHCSLSSYRLAFFLNKYLELRLFRKKEDINFKYRDTYALYPHYLYVDCYNYTNYDLVQNAYRSKIKNKNVQHQQLFDTDSMQTKYLVAEYNTVDYFLKITTENTAIGTKALVHKMQNIPQIVTAYIVDKTQLKSRNNLIFE